MIGPIYKMSKFNSSSYNSSYNSSYGKSTNLSFSISKEVAENKDYNNLIQVYFKGEERPVLSVISNKLNSNTIKVYKCLKTNTYVLIKVESNRIYRITGTNLITIPINNIQSNWQVICTHTNLNELQIKDLYIQYRIK